MSHLFRPLYAESGYKQLTRIPPSIASLSTSPSVVAALFHVSHHSLFFFSSLRLICSLFSLSHSPFPRLSLLSLFSHFLTFLSFFSLSPLSFSLATLPLSFFLICFPFLFPFSFLFFLSPLSRLFSFSLSSLS